MGAYLGAWVLTAIYDPADRRSLTVGAMAASILGAQQRWSLSIEFRMRKSEATGSERNAAWSSDQRIEVESRCRKNSESASIIRVVFSLSIE